MRKMLISLLLASHCLFGQQTILNLQKDCIDRSEEIKGLFQDTLIQVMFKASGNADHGRHYNSKFIYNIDNDIAWCSMDGWDVYFRPNKKFIYAGLAYFNQKINLPNFCSVDSFIIDYKTSLTYIVDTVIPEPRDYRAADVYFIDSIVTNHQILYPVTIYKGNTVIAQVFERDFKVLNPKAINPEQIQSLLRELQAIHEEFNDSSLKL